MSLILSPVTNFLNGNCREVTASKDTYDFIKLYCMDQEHALKVESDASCRGSPANEPQQVTFPGTLAIAPFRS